METWPSSLTGFTDDFSIQPNTVAEKNMTDGGVNHAFSRWTSDIVEISGKLHYGQDDLATFKTFYRDTIKNGTEAFYLTDFPIFGDYETHEVVFKEHPDISYAAWMEWDVSVTLLSSDLGYMTEAAMTALLPEEPDANYVTFPTSVFGEVTDDFSWQQDDLIARGNTDGGDFPFKKRISHVSSTTAQWGIEVSRANMNLFYAWGRYKLAGFKKWFKVELPYGGTTQTVTARFSEPPKATFKGRGDADEGLWTISGNLEIYEVNYWALEDCDALSISSDSPAFLTEPKDTAGNDGETIVFSAVMSGVFPMSYQWYCNSILIEGETSNKLYVDLTHENYDIDYFLIVSNLYGTITSNTVYSRLKPSFLQQPEWSDARTGSTAYATVSVTGSGSISLQWYKDGAILDGETSSTLTKSNLQEEDSGPYYCIATSEYGETKSNIAYLYVDFFYSIVENENVAISTYFSEETSGITTSLETELANVDLIPYIVEDETGILSPVYTENSSIAIEPYFVEETSGA